MTSVIPGFARGALRSLLALSLVLTVAACGTSTSRYGGYSRPTSYDPPGPASDPWGPYIRDASRRFDVPETWIREVMRQESGGRASATSRVGAQGLMQVMPGTYRELQGRYGFSDDAYHPYDNIMSGTAYIREMYDLYGSPAFLAAYNAGPRRLEDYLWNGGSLPGETRNYIARIAPRIGGAAPTRRAPPEVYAAAEIGTYIAPGPRRMDGGTMMALAEERRARGAAPVQLAAAPPPPASAPVRVASIAPVRVASIAPERSGFAAPVRVDSDAPGAGFRPFAPQAQAAPIQTAAVVPSDPAFRPFGSDDAAPVGTVRPQVMASALAAPALAAPLRRDGRGRPVADPAPRQNPGAPAAAPRGFGLIGSAQAASLRPPPAPPARGGSGGGWSVQVGAFASENIARSAAHQARDTVQLLGTRPSVLPVQQGRTTLYRARLDGLTREGAEQACTRLRARGGCAILAPGAS